MNKKRIIWLDQARAIGMFVVMIGHALAAGKSKKYIYSFHMPLFFILSGMTFKNSDEKSVKDYIIDKIKKLLVPYFILNLLMIIVYLVNVEIGVRSSLTVEQLIIGTLYSSNPPYPMIVTTTWFILCLFIIEMLFYIIKRIFKDDRLVFIAAILSGVIGYVNSLTITNKTLPPWHLTTALAGLVFYFLGYIFMKNVDSITQFVGDNKKFILATIMLGIIGHWFAMNNARQISMNQEKYGSILYFYIAAICTSLAFIFVVMRIPFVKLFTFVGQNTIVYLGTHSPIIAMFKKLFPFFAENNTNAIMLCVLLYFALIPVSMLIMKIPGMRWKKKIVQPVALQN